MSKKYLIVASKQDPAGINITTQLSQYRENPLMSSMKNSPGFDFYLIEDDVLHEENLDLQKINQYDFIIFASKHQSEKSEKTLSIHAPGNFREARAGGKSGKVSLNSALFNKHVFEILNEKAKELKLNEKYNITLEATHHGPLIETPCLFIEIGSTLEEWKDRKAGFVIAKTLREAIDTFEENPYREIAIGIGGPHYCPNFNKLQLTSNVALSHVIPGYSLPLTKEMINEVIDKTKEEVDFVVLDWKGLGPKESRDKVIEILEELYINYKKVSEIPK